jgi:hypothetical protein
MIRFRCPYCKEKLQVKDHLAGKKGGCPKCKKPLLIPTPPTPAATKPAEPEPPPADVDALAAAAFADEPANGKHAEPAATIEFTCELCETQITVPREDAGKRMQCPNPECRSIIKVPAPKDGQPKALPTVAQLKQQVEKFDDEAAWGSQTDKTRVTTEALKQVGAVPVAPAPPTSPRVLIRRGMVTMAVIAALVVAVIVFGRATSIKQEKDFEKTALSFVEAPKGSKAEPPIKDPVLKAEVYHAIAEHRIANNHLWRARQPLQTALALLNASAAAPVERDLLLGELAVTAAELGGGTEIEENAKEKWQWDKIAKDFQQILEAIKSPEARVIAVRALATRLLEKDQAGLAVTQARLLSNPEGGRKPRVATQLIALLLLNNKAEDTQVQPPDPAREVPDFFARVGYAEFHARKGSFKEAEALALARGPDPDRLEACVGVAQVILQSKNVNAETALPVVEEALKLAEKKVSPWQVLQTIRVGARVKGSAAVADLPKRLPPEFQPRGYLEIVLAEAATATAPMASSSLEEIKNAAATSPSYDLGWEALARQNARVGRGDIRDEGDFEANQRFKPMVFIGNTLGGLRR